MLVSGGLLALLVSRVDLGELGDALGAADVRWLLLGWGSHLPGMLLSVSKWRLMLGTLGLRHIGFLGLWRLYYIGSFFSTFLPTDVGGDLFRSYEAGKGIGRIPEAMAATFVERLTGFMAIVAFNALGLTLAWSFARSLGVASLLVAVALCFTAGLVLLVNDRTAAILERILARNERTSGFAERVVTFHRSVVSYRGSGAVWRIMAFSFAIQAVGILANGSYAMSLGTAIPLERLILIVPAVMMVGVIPIAINGYGVREAVIVLLFVGAGMTEADAIALALMSRIGLLLNGLVGGVLYALSPARSTPDGTSGSADGPSSRTRADEDRPRSP